MKCLLRITCLLLSSISAHSEDANWPQWPGPDRDGRLSSSALPTALDDTHFSALWQVSLGPTYAGPIIHDGVIYSTAGKIHRANSPHGKPPQT